MDPVSLAIFSMIVNVEFFDKKIIYAHSQYSNELECTV